MSLKDHAMTEFRAAGWIDGDGKWCDEMQELMCTQVLELLDKFSGHGHSGSSAPYAIRIFKNLASWEPLVPLTGDDWEWGEVGDGMFQNKRCSHVFKDKGGAYDINGKIFREADGCCFTSRDSRVPVTFPYTPKSEYVDVPTT